MKINIFIIKDEEWYVAKCIENNVASQGHTIEEAVSNLREAVSLYYEDNEFDTSGHVIFMSMEKFSFDEYILNKLNREPFEIINLANEADKKIKKSFKDVRITHCICLI